MVKVISVENLSKCYQLGQIGTGTFAHDLNVWWAKMRGKPNPMLKIGQTDFGNRDGEEIWALKDISFTVQQGEVLGIIGPNGAGKSTLLKILSRVTAPTRGRIKVKGRIASLLEVGTGFHPELTGRENVYLNGAIMGMNKQEVSRKFDEIVNFAGVEKFIDTPVKRYSSGMYVRLAFAVAAHLDPEILVVDEVLAVGDAEFQKRCLGKMGDVASEGRTVLFVSHNMGMIRSLCLKCILLDKSTIAMNGDSQDVVSYYISSLVNDIKKNRNLIWAFKGKASIDDEMILRKISLIDSMGKPNNYFDITKPIIIEINYDITKTILGMRLVLSLVTHEGVIVLTSTDDFVREYETKPGQYLSRCIIPPNFLNQKEYLLKIRADIPNIKWLLPDKEYLKFIVIGAGQQPGNRYPEKWPGVVAPQLIWETVQLSS
jgi:lipopolysaccharide transport system ATP-binding protein